MADFAKFYTFIEEVFEAGHDFSSDTLKIALTNSAPTPATDTVLDTVTNHPPPAAANGYEQKTVIVDASGQSGGTYTLAVTTDLVWTATAGGIGPFRYAILFNSSKSDKLVGYWDYGSSITLNEGETFTWDVTASILTAA